MTEEELQRSFNQSIDTVVQLLYARCAPSVYWDRYIAFELVTSQKTHNHAGGNSAGKDGHTKEALTAIKGVSWRIVRFLSGRSFARCADAAFLLTFLFLAGALLGLVLIAAAELIHFLTLVLLALELGEL